MGTGLGTDGGEHQSFIVRLTWNEAGVLHGIVERVRTGEKARFVGLDGLGQAIARMIGCEAEVTPGASGPGGRAASRRAG